MAKLKLKFAFAQAKGEPITADKINQLVADAELTQLQLSDVDRLEGALDTKIDVVALSQLTAQKASKTHKHVRVADVEGIEQHLTARAAPHTHEMAEVVGVQTQLERLADRDHWHTMGAVVGLEAELSTKAPTTHTHGIAKISGLREVIDAKSDANHVTQLTEIDGLSNALAYRLCGYDRNHGVEPMRAGVYTVDDLYRSLTYRHEQAVQQVEEMLRNRPPGITIRI